jgi:hypothetical protein
MPGAASPGSDSHGGALGGSRTATVAAQAAGVNIVYVDVTAEFAGHGIGSKKPFINSDGVGAYHPNAAGYLPMPRPSSPQYGAPGWTTTSRWPNWAGVGVNVELGSPNPSGLFEAWTFSR